MQFLIRIILIMIASVSIAVSAFAQDLQIVSQIFKTTGKLVAYDTPDTDDTVVSTWDDVGIEVQLTSYDPDTGWATMLAGDMGEEREVYVRMDNLVLAYGGDIMIKQVSIGEAPAEKEQSAEPEPGLEYRFERTRDDRPLTVYEAPHEKTLRIAELEKGTIVRVLNYDPKNYWSEILFTAEDGTRQEGYTILVEMFGGGSHTPKVLSEVPQVSLVSDGIVRPPQMSPEEPRGQMFRIFSDIAHVSEQPHWSSPDARLEEYGYKKGMEVTLLNYDSKKHWATMLLTEKDGTKREAYVKLYDLDFPGGQEIVIPQKTLRKRLDISKIISKITFKSIIAGLLSLVFWGMILIPSFYGLIYYLSFLRKKWQPFRHNHRLQMRLLVTSACLTAFVFLSHWIFGVELDFVDTSGEFWNFGDRMALLAFYGGGTLLCWPLLMNVIGFLNDLLKAKDLSRLKGVLLSLAVLVYAAMVGYFAVMALISAVIVLLIIIAVIFVGWICLHLVWDTVSNPFGHGGGSGGSGGSSSGGGVEYRCGTCANYSGSKCNLNPGAMVSPNDSCSNFRF